MGSHYYEEVDKFQLEDVHSKIEQIKRGVKVYKHE